MHAHARAICVLIFGIFWTPGLSSHNYGNSFFKPPSAENVALHLQQLQDQLEQSQSHLKQQADELSENINDRITAVIDHATRPQTRSGHENGHEPIIVVDVPNKASNGGNHFQQVPSTHQYPYSGIHVNHYPDPNQFPMPQVPNQFPMPQFPMPQIPNQFPMPQVPNRQPWDIFKFYTEGLHEWWRGPNVCIDRKEIDEPLANVTGIFFSFHTTQCIDTETSHTCTTKLQSHGIRKTYVVTYQCCHGYQRSDRTGMCEKFDVKPMMDTLRSMGGGMFADLISYTGLSDKFATENLTIFCPSDEAMKAFNDDFADNTIVIKPVKRRSIDNYDLVMSHAIQGHLRSGDFIDEQILYTENKEATIRTNVYHTPNKILTANCVPLTMPNQYATNGVAHLVDSVIPPVRKSLGDIINNDRQFTIFKTLLAQSGLDQQLQKDGQYTVFAPTDDAFRQLDPLKFRKYLNGEGCISSVLNYHILPNVVCSGVLPNKARSVTQLGSDVKLKRDEDDIYVNDVPIIQPDVVGTNGVMHVIDGVLVPEEANTVSGVLDEWQLTDLLDLLETANMLNTVDNMQNITFLAPTNEAVQNAAPILNELRQTPEKLQDVLMYHVAQPALSICQIDNNQQVSTASGSKNVRFNQYFTMAFGLSHHTTVQCARIVDMDRKACGVSIQLIDKFLFPPDGHLVDILSSNQTFSIMRKLLKDSILEKELIEHGPYTILAPTDQAFHMLPDKQLNDILTDRDVGDAVIRNHVLPEVLCCAGIQQSHWLFQRSARTLAGNTVPMNKHYGSFMIGNAHILNCDIMADNGVVHAINSVLIPPKPPKQQQNHHRRRQHYNSFIN